MKQVALCFVLILALATHLPASPSQEVSGMVIALDPQKEKIVISCDAIAGKVTEGPHVYRLQRAEFSKLKLGDLVSLHVDESGVEPTATDLVVHPYESADLDPMQAHRMKLMTHASPISATPPLSPGEKIPDFDLVDQDGRKINLAQFSGKIIVVNFMYTRCVMPNFCYRLSNNLGQLQNRFRDRLGKNLVLLTVTFDPIHDRPQQLREYARNWHPTKDWHFVTGSEKQISDLCRRFDVEYYPDEGLFAHTLHTLVIGRDQRLIANIEGNTYTANQLGDLVEAAMSESK